MGPFKNWFVGNCVGKPSCRIPLDDMRLRPGCQQVLDKRKGTKPAEKDDDDTAAKEREAAQAGWIDAGRRMLPGKERDSSGSKQKSNNGHESTPAKQAESAPA